MIDAVQAKMRSLGQAVRSRPQTATNQVVAQQQRERLNRFSRPHRYKGGIQVSEHRVIAQVHVFSASITAPGGKLRFSS
jgi:hypothetical protein